MRFEAPHLNQPVMSTWWFTFVRLLVWLSVNKSVVAQTLKTTDASTNPETTSSSSAPLPPILFIPGIAGSGLFARLTGAQIPECGPKLLYSERSRVWASISKFLPPASHQQCNLAKLKLNYTFGGHGDDSVDNFARLLDQGGQRSFSKEDFDTLWRLVSHSGNYKDILALPEKLYSLQERLLNRCLAATVVASADAQELPVCLRSYSQIDNVEISVGDPGGVSDVDYLDYFQSFGVFGTRYFHEVIEGFRSIGYIERKDMFGFPYDWRLPPRQLDWTRLKELIESIVDRDSEGGKVTIVTHSLGAVVTTLFLNLKVSQEWKDKYIAGMVSIAGAYGGAPKASRSVISGYDDIAIVSIFEMLNITVLPPLVLREFQRSLGSLYTLVPHPEVYGKDRIFIEVQNSSTESLSESQLWDSFKQKYRSVSSAVGGTVYSLSTRVQQLLKPLWPASQAVSGSTSTENYLPTAESLPTVSEELTPRLVVENSTRLRFSGRDGLNEGLLPERENPQNALPIKESSHESLSVEESSYAKPMAYLRRVLLPQVLLKTLRRLPFLGSAGSASISRVAADDDTEIDVTKIPSGGLRHTQTQKYSVSNWTFLLPPEHRIKAKEALSDFTTLTKALEDPGVPVYCLWSTSSASMTEVGYVYLSPDTDVQPVRVMGKGDQTLPTASAAWCSGWNSTRFRYEFVDLEHLEILQDLRVVNLVVSLIAPRVTEFSAAVSSIESFIPLRLVPKAVFPQGATNLEGDYDDSIWHPEDYTRVEEPAKESLLLESSPPVESLDRPFLVSVA